MIFTSGSTGAPKGVVVSEAALSELIRELLDVYALSREDTALQFAAPSFDTSIEQIGVAIAAGATIVIPDEVWAPSTFSDHLRDHRITVADLTPAYFRELPGSVESDRLRMLILGGSLVNNHDLLRARRLFPNARILNAYGLTESVITSTLFEMPPGYDRQTGTAPVGRPLPGVRLKLRPLPGSTAEGEVLLSGRLATGLILDGQGFVPLAAGDSGQREVLRTGDVGRIDDAGNLLITGRIDRQLKVRGFRVDPQEIEQLLQEHPAVADAAVVRSLSADGLAAFYTTNSDLPPGDDALKQHLARSLPGYAIPHRFTKLRSLPQTRHGKTDYAALDQRVRDDPRPGESAPALETPLNTAVAKIWTTVLGVEQLAPDETFFEAGGSSIAAAELVARVRTSLGVHLKFVRPLIERLLREPTFPEFAAAVRQARNGEFSHEEVQSRLILADSDSKLPAFTSPASRRRTTGTPDSVLLTGATGFLGAHLLPRILRSTDATVTCLVRAATAEEARERLRTAWQTYGSCQDFQPGDEARITPVVADLTQENLGLSPALFSNLASHTDLVFHLASSVNFIYPYSEMRGPNVAGTLELLRLASSRGAAFHHVSTMAVVAGYGARGVRSVTESTPLAHVEELGVGYAESKWVAEKLVKGASEAGLPVAVYRAADISGHSRRGTWNTSAEMCCMKKFIADTGAFPKAELPMDYTPVDVFADAMIHIALTRGANGETYHLTNPDKAPIELLAHRLEDRGYEVREVSWDEWTERMVELAVEQPSHPMTPFAPLFIDRAPNGEMSIAEMYLEDTFPEFDRSNVTAALKGSGIQIPPVTAQMIDSYLDFLERAAFL